MWEGENKGDLENLGRNRERGRKEKRKIIIENMRIEREIEGKLSSSHKYIYAHREKKKGRRDL